MIAGKIELDRKFVALAPVIQAALESMKPVAEAGGVRLEVTIDPLGGVVWGDPERLHQVILNLISNGIKFTPCGGDVRIRLKGTDTWADVEVSDTGEGIGSDTLPHVFEQFWQGDSSIARSQAGLGLGLTI